MEKLYEINKKLQWQDFHDSGLISLKFQFCDKENLLYNFNIIMEIVTSFKNDPEKPVIIKCLFKQIKDVEFSMLGFCDYTDLGGIYSLKENCGKVELITVNGWKLSFFSGEINVSFEDSGLYDD
jgi:hypothetical protein